MFWFSQETAHKKLNLILSSLVCTENSLNNDILENIHYDYNSPSNYSQKSKCRKINTKFGKEYQ